MIVPARAPKKSNPNANVWLQKFFGEEPEEVL